MYYCFLANFETIWVSSSHPGVIILKAKVSVLLGCRVPTVLDQQLSVHGSQTSLAFPGGNVCVQVCRVLCHLDGAKHPKMSLVCLHSVIRLCWAQCGGERAPLSTWWPFENACLVILQSVFYCLLCSGKHTDSLTVFCS